ncbi:putative G-protein coupled receptor B0563.6 isoform X1 [Ixodes scapularis]
MNIRMIPQDDNPAVFFNDTSPTEDAITPQVLSTVDPSTAKLKLIAYGNVSLAIIALGIMGNLINLMVLTRSNLRGVTFTYLTWLATSDLLVLSVAVFSMMRLHDSQPRNYAAALYYAHADLPLVNALMASSIFLVVAVTVDRYCAVCRPTRYREFHNARRARVVIPLVYVAAVFLYVPMIFRKRPVLVWDNLVNQTMYVSFENLSVSRHPAFKVYVMVREALVRIGPVLVVIVLNTIIILTFRNLIRKRKQLANGTVYDTKRLTRERRLVVLLVAIVVMFCVCMTPAAILRVLNNDDLESNYGFQVFRAVANDMEMANFAVNFYVYCLCSSDIRRTLMRLFRCSGASSQDGVFDLTSSVGVNTRL